MNILTHASVQETHGYRQLNNSVLEEKLYCWKHKAALHSCCFKWFVGTHYHKLQGI